ncbi:ribonuclease kappa-A [Neoarius graeffei]|uniref:ribonuclease kappa-A n=1 Tax=Neoarius graeffei TaxID=443677 RepID=UPI00298C1226|nr:ribonuclease kappa-A [Neoarius graeffei]
MPSFIFCGPKMATCMLVLSMWGVIMLAMLGIFFSVHSAVLIEDVPLNEQDHQDTSRTLQSVYAVYDQVGYNCFIAAGIYVVIGFVSFVQVRMNKRNNYLVR